MHSSGELQELFQVDGEAPKAPRVTVTAAAAKAFKEAIAGGGDVIRAACRVVPRLAAA
jgi:hypothetical protein